jgi:5'-nucleotidase/UDP-sugar diphosphatase
MTKANPKNVAFHDFLAGEALYAAARAQVKELRTAGADYIVCVAHLGTDAASAPNRSLDVLDNTQGIDLLIDGHSHSVIGGVSYNDTSYNDTVLSSAGTKLEQAGVVIISSTGIETKLISPADYTRYDSEIDAYISAAAEEIDMQLSLKFAETEVFLDGNEDPGTRTQETNLGDLAADAILWAANEATGGGVVAAITNGGGIRASINKGDITQKDIKTVFPFGNTVTTVDITGARLLEVLEASTFGAPHAVSAFPQVAGMEFTILTAVPYAKGKQYPDSTYFAPVKPGSRIVDVMIGGETLDPDKTYKIATNSFLSAGGDTYYRFKGLESYNTSLTLEDALERYTTEVLGGVITKKAYGSPAGRIHIDDREPIEEYITGVFIGMMAPAFP